MTRKPSRPPVGRPIGWHTNTYLVAYTIHIVNRDRYKTPEGDPVEKPIDVALEDMGGLRMMGNVWIVEAPARSRSPTGLRDKLRELLDPGDELLIVPINRPDRVTGVEINDALDVLMGMYG